VGARPGGKDLLAKTMRRLPFHELGGPTPKLPWKVFSRGRRDRPVARSARRTLRKPVQASRRRTSPADAFFPESRRRRDPGYNRSFPVWLNFKHHPGRAGGNHRLLPDPDHVPPEETEDKSGDETDQGHDCPLPPPCPLIDVAHSKKNRAKGAAVVVSMPPYPAAKAIRKTSGNSGTLATRAMVNKTGSMLPHRQP